MNWVSSGWGSTAIRDPMLKAQKPLLDGGDGKLVNKSTVAKIADATTCLLFAGL